MSDKEILEKAIQRAINGGFDIDKAIGKEYGSEYVERLDPRHLSLMLGSIKIKDYYWLIFDHDFAKNLWRTPRLIHPGEGVHFETRDGRSEWQYHLQQMVIDPNPIKYLGENT